MMIIIMATNIYWAFNVFNIALSSMFILLNNHYENLTWQGCFYLKNKKTEAKRSYKLV